MRSFLCKDLCSKSFPYFDRKFIKRRDSGDEGDPGRACDSEIKLFSDPIIGNISYAIRKARWALQRSCGVYRSCTQESFRQRLREECAGSNFSSKISFSMKPRKSEVYRESRYSKIRSQRARGRQSGRIIAEASRDQFIAYLAVKLMMQWFGRSAIQTNHFKSEDRMAAPPSDKFLVDRRFHLVDCMRQRDSSRKPLLIASSRQSGLAISL